MDTGVDLELYALWLKLLAVYGFGIIELHEQHVYHQHVGFTRQSASYVVCSCTMCVPVGGQSWVSMKSTDQKCGGVSGGTYWAL